MKIFIGYGYNVRDQWIEEQVFPLLRSIGFSILHGKDMHGQVLDEEVKNRINQSDAVVGFFTIRDGQGDADYNSHIWVRDEMIYAAALGKSIIPIKETGVKVPDGLLGNRQYIPLDQGSRLICVVELVAAVSKKTIKRVRLDPRTDELALALFRWKKDPSFLIRCRIRNVDGVESTIPNGRLEIIEQGFYLDIDGIPSKGYLEVEGLLGGNTQFTSGWTSTDAIQVKIF